MKEFVISDAQAETAVLVGLITQTQNERKTNEYLDELEFLAHTAGAVTVKRFTQKVNGPNSVTYVGKGKLEEIRAYIEAEEEAEEEAYELFCEEGLCPFDLLKYAMEHDLLPEAQFPFENGKALLHENWDFVARWYLGEYYEGE